MRNYPDGMRLEEIDEYYYDSDVDSEEDEDDFDESYLCDNYDEDREYNASYDRWYNWLSGPEG